MTWDWNARGPMPATDVGTGVVGGDVGTVGEAKQTKAWPRYEADYLRKALMSEQYKYGCEGLDTTQRAVYLDHIVQNYKAEADQCLKAEFDQWLQGIHSCNSEPEIYENADGKPVRKWMFRDKYSADAEGGYKVGQARAGWQHTPWGRTPLTYLPGVREYLRSQKEAAHRHDMDMQMLAEFGPQNIDDAWMYFKHWVKGRPLSDAVCLEKPVTEPLEHTVFDRQPERMAAYDPDTTDRQPGVLATDPNAEMAAVAAPGEPAVKTTTPSEDANVQQIRSIRAGLENFIADKQAVARAAEAEDKVKTEQDEAKAVKLEIKQESREAEESAPLRII